MAKNKKKDTPKMRNSFVKTMMKRHHGSQVHKDKREKRADNPKNDWMAEWEDDLEDD